MVQNGGGGNEVVLVDQLPTEVVPICALATDDGSPRLAGEDIEHIKTLAQVESDLPPILVHRQTMRVIDGVHRLRAFEMCGRREITVRFFEGDEKAAFLLAVQSNIAHGLPLTLADRTAAAVRIVVSYPHWSNRAIAKVAGLSAATVAAVRGRSAPDSLELSSRLGRDGRSRPADSAQARRRVSALIAANPDASLRNIAKEAGVSPATVQDVRKRLERGDDPVPLKNRKDESAGHRLLDQKPTGILSQRSQAPEAVLMKLRRDPSIRLSEAGRDLLMWLGTHSLSVDEWESLIDRIPPHCVPLVAELACSCAHEWASFANELKLRSQQAGLRVHPNHGGRKRSAVRALPPPAAWR
jgi:ParB-like chromosome segregation protein Spo0J